MKKIISLSILLLQALMVLTARGGELNVVSFGADAFDISASTNKRLDLNGQPCALVIVELPIADCQFAGGVVGDCEFKISEHWVYLTKGTKRFKIQAAGYPSLMVSTVDSNGDGVNALTTYRLKLSGYEADMVRQQEYEKKLNDLEKKLEQAQSANNVPEKPAAPTKGTTKGHDWVDLGLPSGTRWATTNVGAKTPTDGGNFYTWGETKPKKLYNSSTNSHAGRSLGEICGNSAYDVATATWGDKWQMPTDDQLRELMEQCKWTWKNLSGTEGYNIVGPNGNSIFLPAAGEPLDPEEEEDDDAPAAGYYWSGSEFSGYTGCVNQLFFSKTNKKVDWSYGYNGCSVRPVLSN